MTPQKAADHQIQDTEAYRRLSQVMSPPPCRPQQVVDNSAIHLTSQEHLQLVLHKEEEKQRAQQEAEEKRASAEARKRATALQQREKEEERAALHLGARFLHMMEGGADSAKQKLHDQLQVQWVQHHLINMRGESSSDQRALRQTALERWREKKRSKLVHAQGTCPMLPSAQQN